MGVYDVILLDENQQIIHDEDTTPSEGIKKALLGQDAVCFHANEDVLYHFYPDGSLSLYSLSKPKFHTVMLSRFDLDFFCKEGRVATKDAVVRDVGCERSMVYLEGHSFYVPTELLRR